MEVGGIPHEAIDSSNGFSPHILHMHRMEQAVSGAYVPIQHLCCTHAHVVKMVAAMFGY